MSLERELRDTSDSLLRALDQINDLESEKRALPTGSKQFVELAREIERLAGELLRGTEREASLAEATEARRDAGGGTGRPIEAISGTPRDMSVILADWRAAERALVEADPASAEASVAAANVRRLREEYRLGLDQRLAEHRNDGS